MTEMPFVNVDDWKDVLVVVIIVFGGWISTLLTLRAGQKKAHRLHADLNEKVDDVVGQVRNGHTVPLRADLDRMLEGQRRQEELLSDTHRIVTGQGEDIRNLQNDVQELKRVRPTLCANTQAAQTPTIAPASGVTPPRSARA